MATIAAMVAPIVVEAHAAFDNLSPHAISYTYPCRASTWPSNLACCCHAPRLQVWFLLLLPSWIDWGLLLGRS